MDVFFLRHGEAGKRLPSSSKDYQRTLTAAGRNEVEQIANAFLEMRIKFDLIATSPLKRAFETAEIVAKVMKSRDGELETWDELKPEGQRSQFYRKLSKIGDGSSSILIVGHEPYLSSTIGEMISGSNCSIVLKKAGIAKVRLIEYSGTEPRGELRWLLTPRQLKAIH